MTNVLYRLNQTRRIVEKLRYYKKAIDYIQGLVATDRRFLYDLREFGLACKKAKRSNVLAPLKENAFPDIKTLPKDLE